MTTAYVKTPFHRAFVLDRVVSARTRERLSSVFGWLVILPLVFGVLNTIAGGFFSIRSETLGGVALLFFTLWLVVAMFTWYWRSYYYIRAGQFESKKGLSQALKDAPAFEVAQIYFRSRKSDVVSAFLSSSIGELVMLRCGIPAKEVKIFLKERKKQNIVLSVTKLQTPEGKQPLFVPVLAAQLFNTDEAFEQFLFKSGVSRETLVGASRWVAQSFERAKTQDRWWGKAYLGRLQTIGSDWAYGAAYKLARYSTELTINPQEALRLAHGEDEEQAVELVLSREREANVLLVGEEGVGKMDVVRLFAQKVAGGSALHNLVGKRIVLLDTKTLIAQTEQKGTFEREVLAILGDIVKSGNIILVIENLPGFVRDSEALGADVLALMDPYLSSHQLQVIALSDPTRFHNQLGRIGVIQQRFETVLMEEPEEDEVVSILEYEAALVERKYKLFFTYAALLEIARGAENYIAEGVMPDKAIDVLVELQPYARVHKKKAITPDVVRDFLSSKTGISVGDIDTRERETLLNLEDKLHRRVIGQESAIQAISGAIRRARAGVRSLKRPIGAFLFIGPTGVGKTETAKALAESYFGSEESMSRLDMSEYQTTNALTRLIGSFEGGQAGTLTTTLKEKPYGVLLLDELEKTNNDVLDLLLQVFDEGVFHDAQGSKVNARNTIFIATSNAASDMIRDAVKQGTDLVAFKDEIVDEIIKRGIFRPEFLNRFDGVILFHPLAKEHYEKIAVLMLKSLSKRLRKEKGIELIINQPLIDVVIAEGSDPQFGARPMRRVIQDKIEQAVAEKLIRGDIQRGSRVELLESDLS